MLLNISPSLFHPELWWGCRAHQHCLPQAACWTVGWEGLEAAQPSQSLLAQPGCAAYSSITIPTRFLESLTTKLPFVLCIWRFSSPQIPPQTAAEYARTALIPHGWTPAWEPAWHPAGWALPALTQGFFLRSPHSHTPIRPAECNEAPVHAAPMQTTACQLGKRMHL